MPQSLHRNLTVWNKAMDLVVRVYGVTSRFPATEQFGITSQMRRAAVSIPCNVAEGKGRTTNRAFANHLSIARGSLNELETLVEIAQRIEMLDPQNGAQMLEECEQVSKMLLALKRSLD